MSSEPENTHEDSSVAPSETAPQYVVRFGSMRTLGVMKSSENYRYGEKIVAKTSRGTELGTILCEATSAAIDHLEEPTDGKILRQATDGDVRKVAEMEVLAKNDIDGCQRSANDLRLAMEVVDVERLLGGERVVVYYLAEKRVDFRQLVRNLAGHFQTRIEMRQIGVRDEAKLLADYGDCGQPICCASFLSKMPPVSMRMAKLQKATLDPTKISGRCGRLKCCLRYEFDTYEELASELPPIGSLILTRDGSATVLGQDILSQQLAIKTEDNRRIMIPGSDVLTVTRRGFSAKNRK